MSKSYREQRADLKNRPRRWLVTGVAGFIGSALVEELLLLRQEVIGVDNFATGNRSNVEKFLETTGERFALIEGDIRDPSVCYSTCRDVDFVLHQAALGSVPRSVEDPMASHTTNVDGFLNVALAARDSGVARVVYASSSSVYGDHAELPKREANTGRPLSPYAATKAVDEVYADVIQRTYGLELVGLRYFNVFGRRQRPDGPYAAVIPRWIGNLMDGQRCSVFGDGRQSRDFCYVDNVVQANILAALVGGLGTGAVFNVGYGRRTDLIQLFELLKRSVAGYVPAAAKEQLCFEAARAGDVKHSLADISKITEQLGYRPTHDLEQGLSETTSWFAEQGGHEPLR